MTVENLKNQCVRVSALGARLLGIGGMAIMLSQCASRVPTPSASSISGRLATPPHNMTKSEYPFDDKGNYRREWVKRGASGRTSSSILPPDPVVNNYGARKPVNVPVSNRPPQTINVPPPRTSPPAPAPSTYHTVRSGETLYAIGRKYGISVADLKRKNAISGDLIRIGQKLRVR